MPPFPQPPPRWSPFVGHALTVVALALGGLSSFHALRAEVVPEVRRGQRQDRDRQQQGDVRHDRPDGRVERRRGGEQVQRHGSSVLRVGLF